MVFISYWTRLESLRNHYPVDSTIHLLYNPRLPLYFFTNMATVDSMFVRLKEKHKSILIKYESGLR